MSAPYTSAPVSARPRGSEMPRRATMAKSTADAAKNRMEAPQNGGSSRFEKRTPTQLAPRMSVATRNASSVMRSTERGSTHPAYRRGACPHSPPLPPEPKDSELSFHQWKKGRLSSPREALVDYRLDERALAAGTERVERLRWLLDNLGLDPRYQELFRHRAWVRK